MALLTVKVMLGNKELKRNRILARLTVELYVNELL